MATVKELRARVAEAQERAGAANRALYEVQAQLEEAEGDVFGAKWSRAIAAGDTKTAHGCWIESEARRVLAGKERAGTRDDAEVAAMVERLRAEQQQAAPS